MTTSTIKKLGAILIDPFTQDIREIEITQRNGSCLESLYKAIECYMVECVQATPVTDIWIDEEGLYNTPEHYFILGGRFFFGRAVLLDHNEEGECVACGLSSYWLRKHVTFGYDATRNVANKLIEQSCVFVAGDAL